MANAGKLRLEETSHFSQVHAEPADHENYEKLFCFFANLSLEIWAIHRILNTYLPMFVADVCLNGLPYILTFRIENDRLVLVDMFLLEGDPLVFSDEREYLEYFEKARQEFESLDMFSI